MAEAVHAGVGVGELAVWQVPFQPIQYQRPKVSHDEFTDGLGVPQEQTIVGELPIEYKWYLKLRQASNDH